MGSEAERDIEGSFPVFHYHRKPSRSERGDSNNHPTVKPVNLVAWLLNLVSRPGDLILDPFAGSGTTLVAALKTGRRAIGIELDPAYVEIARQRIGETSPDSRWGQRHLFDVPA
jgi:DNA modification methylase